MSDRVIAAVLRRDRGVILGALLAVATAAWAFLIWLADMPMDDMRHGAAFGFRFAIWTVMMIGMMTPAVSPMILLYARVGRQAAAHGMPFAPAGWFAAGYLAAWTGFALAAALAQSALEHQTDPGLAMTPAPRALGGLMLVVAGLYQLSPLKQTCLARCQHPLAFIQHHGGFRGDPAGAVLLGARHGLYCVGCCWALMGLLFVAGTMSLLWTAALTILVLAEKLVAGPWLARAIGTALLLGGSWMLLAAQAGR